MTSRTAFQERFAGEHYLFSPPLMSHRCRTILFIDQEVRPDSAIPTWTARVEGQASIPPRHPQVREVAEQRVGQLERLCKHFLRERMVRVDA